MPTSRGCYMHRGYLAQTLLTTWNLLKSALYSVSALWLCTCKAHPSARWFQEHSPSWMGLFNKMTVTVLKFAFNIH